MARIGIMTFLHNDNYGSSLQAYALQRVIRTLGYDCEHIDYRPDRAENSRERPSSIRAQNGAASPGRQSSTTRATGL